MSSGAIPKIYIIDTCCYMDLDRIHPRPQYACSESERVKIWKGIGSLGKQERVYLISHIHDELEQHYPKPLPDYFRSIPIIKTGLGVPDLSSDVAGILAIHPSLINPTLKHTKDSADPWIIAVARKNGWIVVTNELPGKSPAKCKIPDACEDLGVKCLRFEAFVQAEGLL
jgi:hypothetical protein